MNFHEKLRQLKGEMSEAGLAKAAELPYPSVHSYCLGRRMPSFPAIVKMAKALGVTCEAFADCDDVAGEPPPKKKSAKPKIEAPAPKRQPKQTRKRK